MSIILQTPFVGENFPYLADRILNYTMLMINGNPHRICEIEFYLNSYEHPDPYVHGHVDQTKSATWYFHRHSTGTYKNGTFKGMDLVLGSEGKYGAVLIRSLFDIKQRELIEGPCNCVKHILMSNGYSDNDIIGFTENESLNILSNKRNLILIEGYPEIKEIIKWAPRVGLSDKYPEYRNKLYRYIIGPVKKERKKMTLVSPKE